MPTYEYRCKSCGHTFEKFQPMSAAPVKRCPECKKAVERLIGAGAGVIFKGSGFYGTDYRSDSYKQEAKKDSGSGSESSSSDAKSAPDCKGCPKSESCPEKKSAKE